MGATMAVEIIGRGNINVAKTHLDAAFLIKWTPLWAKITTVLLKCFIGINEHYPKKSAALLKKYLPDLTDVEYSLLSEH